MSGSLIRFNARPLFYDALSGEVHPPSDRQQQTHTLGRLAYAGVSKGDAEIIEDSTSGYLLYRYRPSWAHHILATVECEMETDERGEMPTQLRSIELKDTYQRTLFVADENLHGPQNIFVSILQQEIRMPLRLGEDLVRAQLVVAHAAQTFFDLAR